MSDKVKDLTKIRKKDKRRTVFKVIGLLVLVILLIAGILFTKPYWTPALDTVSLRINRIIHSSEEDGEFATKNFPVEISSDIDYQVARMDNYFALLSDTHLYLYNLDGELSDDRKYSYKNPVLKEADKKTLIYESGGTHFRVDNKYKMLYEKQVDNDIIFARISNEGYVAVVTNSEAHICTLTVYNSEGKQIYSRESTDRIIEVCFNQDSTGCSLVSVNAESGEIVSQAHTFDFNSVEEKWVSTELATLCLSAYFTQENGIFIFGDEMCAYYDSTGVRLGGYAYKNDLIDGTFVDGKVAMIFKNEEIRKTSLVLINGSDATPMEIEIDKELKYIYADENQVYMLTGSSIETYSYNGKLLKQIPISDTYYKFVRIGDYMFLLGYDKIDRVMFRG